MSAAHAGYWAVVVAIVVRGDRVLAMRRAATNGAGAGLWETLSGRLEPGEQPLDGAAREIAEECGLEVRLDPRPVDAYVADRKGVPMMVVVYRADWVSGEVRRSQEHDDHAWLTAAELRARTPFTRLADAVDRALAV